IQTYTYTANNQVEIKAEDPSGNWKFNQTFSLGSDGRVGGMDANKDLLVSYESPNYENETMTAVDLQGNAYVISKLIEISPGEYEAGRPLEDGTVTLANDGSFNFVRTSTFIYSSASNSVERRFADGTYQIFNLGSNGRFDADDKLLAFKASIDGELVEAVYRYNADDSFSRTVTNLTTGEIRIENYNASGAIVSMTIPTSAVQGEAVPVFEFENGILVRRIDPDGTVTHFDPVTGLITLVEHPDGTYETYQYQFDAAGEVSLITRRFSTGREEKFLPDGRIVELTTAEGLRQTYTYYENKELEQIVIVDLTKPVEEGSPELGKVLQIISYAYEGEGDDRITIETIEDLENKMTITIRRNAIGDLLSVVSVENRITKIFDENNVLIETVDANGMRTIYEHGLIKQIIDPMGMVKFNANFSVDPVSGHVTGIQIDGQDTFHSSVDVIVDPVSGNETERHAYLNTGQLGIVVRYRVNASGVEEVIDVSWPEQVENGQYTITENGEILLTYIFQGNAAIIRFGANPVDGEFVILSVRNIAGREDVYVYDDDTNADLDYVLQSDGTMLIYLADAAGVSILDFRKQPKVGRSVDREGRVTIFDYEYGDSKADTLDRTVTYVNDSLQETLRETQFDETGEKQQFVFEFNREGKIISRSEFSYVDDEISLVLQYDTSDLSETDARTTGLGELETTTYYTTTVFGVPIVSYVEDTKGNKDTYTYDPVGRGFLEKISRTNADGHLKLESFFSINQYTEAQLDRTISYTRDGTEDRPKTQSLFFYDGSGKLKRIEEYEVLGEIDPVLNGALQPNTGDQPDRILSTTFFENGNPKRIERNKYASDGRIIEHEVTDFTNAIFDSRGDIIGGSISTLTTRPDQTLKTESEVTFTSEGNPAVS
ncbi:MAG: hypothetical protein HY584_02250, partial [Candidatus Omnitrophica bacterium]|nr:hypothetical protein [Candidatus Omnitrophota bacterium]